MLPHLSPSRSAPIGDASCPPQAPRYLCLYPLVRQNFPPAQAWSYPLLSLALGNGLNRIALSAVGCLLPAPLHTSPSTHNGRESSLQQTLCVRVVPFWTTPGSGSGSGVPRRFLAGCVAVCGASAGFHLHRWRSAASETLSWKLDYAATYMLICGRCRLILWAAFSKTDFSLTVPFTATELYFN
jgi:hypothetical protein